MTSKGFNWDRKISLKEIAQFYEDRIREADSSLSRIKEEMIGLEKRIKEAESELQKGASERKRLQQAYFDLPNAFREEFSRIYDIMGLFLQTPSTYDIEKYYLYSIIAEIAHKLSLNPSMRNDPQQFFKADQALSNF